MCPNPYSIYLRGTLRAEPGFLYGDSLRNKNLDLEIGKENGGYHEIRGLGICFRRQFSVRFRA